MTYDLIVKGGNVLAPGDDLSGHLDVAIAGGRIAAIAPAIEGDARRVVDVRGALVTPGLIDLHTHVDFGMRTEGINARGANPDLIGVRAGVPTLVDAGTTGPFVFGGFRNYVIDPARTRILCFLHAGRGGITMEPDVRFEEDVNLDAFAKAVELHRDVIVGVKTRLIGPGMRTLGVRIMELSKEAARRVGLPLMVHTGDHFSRFEGSQEVTRAALRLIEAGDIIEHTYTSLPGGMVDAAGRIVPELLEAIQRGAVISAASGGSHLSFRVARTMLDKGIKPSFIASDLNSINYRRGCFSFTEIMSQFLALGLTLEEVIRRSTIEPARGDPPGGDAGPAAGGRRGRPVGSRARGGPLGFHRLRRDAARGGEEPRARADGACRRGDHPRLGAASVGLAAGARRVRADDAGRSPDPGGLRSGIARPMAALALTLATRDYDYVQALALRDVVPDGIELTVIRAFDALERFLADPAIDAGEASFSQYLRRVAAGDRSLVGLPAFVMREFRHRCLFVRGGSSLTDVSQLAGRRVGVDAWAATGNIWTRAILRGAGVPLDGIRWMVGPVNRGEAPVSAEGLPAHVAVAPPGRALGEMVAAGDLDAMMAPWPPKEFDATGGPTRPPLRRLPHRRARVLPPDPDLPGQHLVVLRRPVVDRHPWVVPRLYDALVRARERSEASHLVLHESSPWVLADLEEQTALMGADFRAYGYRDRQNREMVAAFCAEQLAQGLIAAPLDPDVLFADFLALTDPRAGG